MQNTKALHSSNFYKKQVRSLTDIIKGFAQNLNKNVCQVLVFNYFESSSPNYGKCCAFLLQNCTFRLFFSRTGVHFNLSQDPVKTLL